MSTDAWIDFARGNHGEGLLPEQVLGQDLLDSVGDETVRELYIRMIRRARTGTPVRFHYRCDAPDRRRMFEMKIHMLTGGEVEFVSTLRYEDPRPLVALLDPRRLRDDRLLLVCSWCQKVALPDKTWVPVESAVESLHLLEEETFPRLTHGICESCLAKWAQESGVTG